MMNAPFIPSDAPDALGTSGSKPKTRNDNSNPQQGTGGSQTTSASRVARSLDTPLPSSVPYSRPSLRIPPTQKDERKLFVGGLPANGE
jgi:hypothetical protein